MIWRVGDWNFADAQRWVRSGVGWVSGVCERLRKHSSMHEYII